MNKKSDYNYSVSKYLAQYPPQKPAAQPHYAALVYWTGMNYEKMKRAKKS